jgi:hypothetical protein
MFFRKKRTKNKSSEEKYESSGVLPPSIAEELKKRARNGGYAEGEADSGAIKRGLSLSSIADGLGKYENQTTAEADVEAQIRNAVIRKGLAGSSIADGVADVSGGEPSAYSLKKIKRRLTAGKTASGGDAISPKAVEKTADASKNPTSAYGKALDGIAAEKNRAAVFREMFGKYAAASKNPTETAGKIKYGSVGKKIQASDKIRGLSESADGDGGENVEPYENERAETDGNDSDGQDEDGGIGLSENKYVQKDAGKKTKKNGVFEERYSIAYGFYSEMDGDTARRLIEGDAYLKNYLGEEYYKRLRGQFDGS